MIAKLAPRSTSFSRRDKGARRAGSESLHALSLQHILAVTDQRESAARAQALDLARRRARSQWPHVDSISWAIALAVAGTTRQRRLRVAFAGARCGVIAATAARPAHAGNLRGGGEAVIRTIGSYPRRCCCCAAGRRYTGAGRPCGRSMFLDIGFIRSHFILRGRCSWASPS